MKKVLKMFKASLAWRSGCAAFTASCLLSGSGLEAALRCRSRELPFGAGGQGRLRQQYEKLLYSGCFDGGNFYCRSCCSFTEICR